MPSLSDLQQFKASFHDLGGQKADLQAKSLPFDDLELPAAKPEAAPQGGEAPAASSGAAGPSADSPPAPKGGEPAPLGAGFSPADDDDDFDFSTLIGTQLGDLPAPAFDDEGPADGSAPGSGQEASPDAQAAAGAGAEADAANAEEFYVPQELLSNLSQELDAAPPDFPEDEFIEDDAAWPGELEIDELDEEATDIAPEEFAFPEEALSDEPLAADEAPGAESGDGLGLDDLGDLDGFSLSDEPLAADEAPGAESGDGLGLGDLDGFDLSDEPLAADEAPGAESGDGLGLGDLSNLDDFSLSDDPLAADEASGADSEGLGLDDLGGLDGFSLSDEPLSADEAPGAESSDGLGLDDLGGLDGFSLSDNPFAADEASGADSDGLGLDDLGDLDGFSLSDEPLAAGEAPGAESGDGLGLGDLGGLDDFSLSDEPLAADEVPGADSDGLGLDDLGDLDGFGLSDDPFAADEASGANSDGLGLDDLGDLDGFGLSDDPFAADGASGADSDGLGLDDLGDLDGFGLSDDPFAADEASGADSDDLGLDDLGDLDGFSLSDDPFAADEASGADSDGLGLDDLGDLDGFGLSDDPFAADGASGADSDGLGLDDLGDLDGFGLSDDPFAADGAFGSGGGLGGFDDLAFSDELPGAESSGFGGFDLSDDPLAGDGLGLGDLDGLGLSDDPFAPDGLDGLEGEGFSPDDLSLSDDPFAPEGLAGLEGEGFSPDDLSLSDDPFAPEGLSGLEGEGLSPDDLSLSDDPFAPDGLDEPDSAGLDIDDFAFPGEPFSADGTEEPDSTGLDIDDFAFPGEPLSADGAEEPDSAGLDIDDFVFPGEPLSADGAEEPGSSSLDIDDFALPGEPFSADGGEEPSSSGLDLDDFALPGEPFSADGAEEPGSAGLDLDDFALPGEPFSADGAEEPGSSGLDIDDFALPGEAFSADGAEEPGSASLDIDEFALPGEAFSADGAEEPGSAGLDIGGFALPGEAFPADGADESGIDGLDGFDLPTDPVFSDGLSGEESGDLGAGGFGDFAEDGPIAADGQAGADGGGFGSLDGFDISADPVFSDGLSGEEGAGGFDLGAGPEGGGEGAESDISGAMDFDLGDVLGRSAAPPPPPEKPAEPAAQGKAAFWAKPKQADAPAAPRSLEDIKISEDEFKALQDTLSGYPLNLRIACQEIIVEQDASPEKMSRLISGLARGAPARETAALAGEILGKTIAIPKGFEKSSGEALAAEQGTLGYIFANTFLPVFKIAALIGLLLASVLYLGWTFVVNPQIAESIYRQGYERIAEGNFRAANDYFDRAFGRHRNRKWFYRYAEAFISARQFALAEQKYERLLRYFPRDRRGVLDFAALQTNHQHNFERADSLIRRNLLDFNPNDIEALLAAGDNSLAWAERDPSRFEDARIAFARVMELQGWTPPVAERMMKYFIRTDNLGEVLRLREWFDAHPRRTMQAPTLAELGGYLLDKQFEETRGVPNEFRGQIQNVPDSLREAMRLDPSLPEPFYHLARFYNALGRPMEERGALAYAVRAFDAASARGDPEPVPRLRRRIDAHRRYADVLIGDGELFPAREQLTRAVGLYEDGIRRRIMGPSPDYGRLFAGLGDLEFFARAGDMGAALNFYHTAARHGWAPPEMRFRMGAAYYRLEDWGSALEHFFVASSDLPLNRRVLFALGNSALKRGDLRAAQGYYGRLLSVLEAQRSRLPILLPNDRPDYLEVAERLMMARNNAGVAYELLAAQTGNLGYRARAMALYAESQRAWDAGSRHPETMIRSGSVPLAYLNLRNALRQENPDFEPQIFIRIDRDALETSIWERVAPRDRHAEGDGRSWM